MLSARSDKYDFFLSRRGSVAGIAQEVTDVLKENGYKVRVQDYDIPITANFIEEMHEAVKNARDLVVLFTRDYEQSPYTRMEFTSFEANAARSGEKRRMVILRCDDAPLLGLFAPHVYQDLVGIGDAQERRSRILAAAEGRSQALEPPPRPFIGVPPRIASFTGRAEELNRLDAILMQDKPAAVTQASVGRAAVQGIGGVGKTSLAVEYAHRYRNLYAGVCWCPAEARTGLLSALASLAVTLGAAAGEEPDVEKAAKAALRRLTEQRATWLLIYDNVTAPDQMADLLPSAGSRVLITSRFSDWSELADEVALDVLPLDEAIFLLETRTGRSDAAGAKTLSEALGRLPLALDHAAAYCKRSQMQFGDYARRTSSLIDSAPRGVGYPRSIAATFNLAIAEAVEQCQAAEALMAYCAQCAPERIPMALVEGAVENELEGMKALAALAEVSLVKHDPFEDGVPAITVHRLVQAVSRVRSEANGSVQNAIERLLARLVAIYPAAVRTETRLWPLCAQLTPHFLALYEVRDRDAAKLTDWAVLLTRAGSYFHGRAAYPQAEQLFRDALAIREQALGPEHPDTAISLNCLALLRKSQGYFSEAQRLYERAVAIHEKTLGPEHPDTAMSLNWLAVVLIDQGKLAKAQPLLERALTIHEKVLGHEHQSTAVSLNWLAVLLNYKGEFAGARSLYERALAIREKAHGPEHVVTAISLTNLALLLVDEGNLAEARSFFERALAIQEKALGPEHPETINTVSRLGLLLADLKDGAAALPLLERALAIREKVLGPEHPDTATSLNKVAILRASHFGDLAGARALYERALAIREKALGPEHPATAQVLYNFAMLLEDQSDFEGAQARYERARAIWEKVLGPDHPYTLASLDLLAVLMRDRGDLAKSRPLLERALATREKVLGPEHRDTALSLNNLGVLLWKQGDFAGARALYERALAVREKLLGPEHDGVAQSLNNLAVLLYDQGDLTGARPLLERALTILEKRCGSDHKVTNRTRYHLARLLVASGHPTEALAFGYAARAAHENVLGREHSWSQDSARVTADALDAIGQTENARALRERYGLTQP